jgi:Kef-type K+ transport system membrane component KefB
MDATQVAAVLAATIVLASIVSVEVGLSVALIELGLGVLVGNLLNVDPNTDWLVFIATFASIVLTFLAGAEVDPDDFRARWVASVSIGVVSFVGPFVVAGLIAYGPLGWDTKAALIAGTALSTTSLAVVYAVLVETALNTTSIGKLIMSACFVTDMGTAIALSAIFIKPNAWFPAFLVVSIALIVVLPKLAPWFFRRYGDRVIEPEIKLIFLCLFILMVLANAAKGHAVLPAFVLGLVMAKHYQEHKQEQERLRVVAFAFLTPFFFLRGGLNVSLGAVFANLGLLGILFAAKMVPKVGLIMPLGRRYVPEYATFTTLLMSTGLTFGTISSLYGLQAGIIDKTQFSLLVTVVVFSAIVPTAIAQRWFSPDVEVERLADRTEPMPRAAEPPPQRRPCGWRGRRTRRPRAARRSHGHERLPRAPVRCGGSARRRPRGPARRCTF